MTVSMPDERPPAGGTWRKLKYDRSTQRQALAFERFLAQDSAMTVRIPPQISLRALREALGLTMDQLAERIRAQGVEFSKVGVNNVELGHRNASPTVLRAWAKALGVDAMHIRQSPEMLAWLAAVQADEDARSAA
jgi:hypothetical protein